MVQFIVDNYMGTTITLAIKGLPCTITGQVIKSSCDDLVTLRLADGNKVAINGKTVAFIV